MLYRKNIKNGDELSQLGYGCMRFPKKGMSVDIAKSTELMREAIEAGVNYFDTAYFYVGIEAAMGKIIRENGWRDKVKIATKMPIFLVRKNEDLNKYFEQQLERLQTDYVDYYLMHMLTDLESFERAKKLGLGDWIKKEKDAGRIKNIGFSFHGKKESFKEIIDAYDWEFCMIQYNYLDEDYQAGTDGLKYAHTKGLPIIVMEPLRGGKLAVNLPEDVIREFEGVHPDRSPAEWGLRWVWAHPEVTCVLSGMSEGPQLKENLRVAGQARAGEQSEEETKAYDKAVKSLRSTIKVNCTGCGYCMPCPANIDIPTTFSRYNDSFMLKRTRIIGNYMMEAGVFPAKTRYARACMKCGKCEQHCPQEILIMEELEKAAKYLEPFWIKPVAKIIRAFTVGKQE